VQFLDMADTFVSHCNGLVTVWSSCHHQVGMAQGRGLDLDKDLSWARLWNWDIVNLNLLGFLRHVSRRLNEELNRLTLFHWPAFILS